MPRSRAIERSDSAAAPSWARCVPGDRKDLPRHLVTNPIPCGAGGTDMATSLIGSIREHKYLT